MRIVGGTARGRRLAPPARATRPTADHLREALFNSLAATSTLDGARVLDLFAGTGAVGLEALSRGAAVAVLVESNRAALAVLRRNVGTVGLPGAQVIARPVAAYLDTDPREFDLVFADPPYALADNAVQDVLGALATRGWLAPDAVVVLERPARTRPGSAAPAWAAGLLTTEQERRYADAVLWYGRRR